MNTSTSPPTSASTASRQMLRLSARRVIMLTTVCGFVEVIGYSDAGNIYPAIMTGNTVQLGWSLAEAQWARFGLIAYAIGAFFIGCMIASAIRRHLRRPPFELVIMAALLIVAGMVRLHPALRIPLELPLLALALGMQGETISRFGAVSLQTIVVTNNMVKFSDAFVGRYFAGQRDAAKRADLSELLLPGLAWLTYSLSAAAGALAAHRMTLPFLLPAVLLLLITADLLLVPYPDHKPGENT